eukprot:scaffold17222_cov110-Isochrysis_galbana.AAC.2
MGGGVEQRAAERPRPRVMKHMSEQVWVFSLGRAVAAWRETQQGAEHSALHSQLFTPGPFSARCSVISDRTCSCFDLLSGLQLPPPHFNRQLEQDVHHLLWTKEPNFDPTSKGTHTTAKPWINKHAIHNPKRSNKRVPSLGLGLIDWESHCSALRIKWILNYLNATRGPWKSVLDAWLARPEMGRASICTSTRSSQLIRAIDTKPSLPPFWAEAVKEFKRLKLNRIKDSDANHRSQPL